MGLTMRRGLIAGAGVLTVWQNCCSCGQDTCPWCRPVVSDAMTPTPELVPGFTYHVRVAEPREVRLVARNRHERRAQAAVDRKRKE